MGLYFQKSEVFECVEGGSACIKVHDDINYISHSKKDINYINITHNFALKPLDRVVQCFGWTGLVRRVS
jgi:hypothetical protein